MPRTAIRGELHRNRAWWPDLPPAGWTRLATATSRGCPWSGLAQCRGAPRTLSQCTRSYVCHRELDAAAGRRPPLVRRFPVSLGDHQPRGSPRPASAGARSRRQGSGVKFTLIALNNCWVLGGIRSARIRGGLRTTSRARHRSASPPFEPLGGARLLQQPSRSPRFFEPRRVPPFIAPGPTAGRCRAGSPPQGIGLPSHFFKTAGPGRRRASTRVGERGESRSGFHRGGDSRSCRAPRGRAKKAARSRTISVSFDALWATPRHRGKESGAAYCRRTSPFGRAVPAPSLPQLGSVPPLGRKQREPRRWIQPPMPPWWIDVCAPTTTQRLALQNGAGSVQGLRRSAERCWRQLVAGRLRNELAAGEPRRTRFRGFDLR